MQQNTHRATDAAARRGGIFGASRRSARRSSHRFHHRLLATAWVLLGISLLAGCAHRPPSDPSDPLETVNRQIYKFNDLADTYVLRPTAVGYDKITPDRVQRSVGNFFDNAHQPVTMANSLMQLKFGKFNVSLARFLINSSVGVGGLIDVASKLKIDKTDEDLGQTLGYWGVGPGPYLVLPLLGPSDVRDFSGSLGDQFANPITYLNQFDAIDDDYSWIPYALRALQGINARASILGFDSTLAQQFDPYAFVRGYYLENRLENIYDGDVPERLKATDDIEQSFPGDDGMEEGQGTSQTDGATGPGLAQ